MDERHEKHVAAEKQRASKSDSSSEPNTWAKVASSIDLKESAPGAKDVARMKAVIIARKDDKK